MANALDRIVAALVTEEIPSVQKRATMNSVQSMSCLENATDLRVLALVDWPAVLLAFVVSLTVMVLTLRHKTIAYSLWTVDAIRV